MHEDAAADTVQAPEFAPDSVSVPRAGPIEKYYLMC